MKKNRGAIKRVKSFKYAFAGILHTLLNEPNFRIHVIATVVVIVLGEFFNISNIEWAVIVIITSLVLTAELMNTVVENIIDYLFPDIHDVAKVVKDVASGYVLINAIASLFIFAFIFGPRLATLHQILVDNHYNIVQTKEDYEMESKDLDINNNSLDEQKEIKDINDSMNTCSKDSDCIVSGCNQEICATEEMMTACVVPDYPLPKDLGQSCACSNSKCVWN